MPQSRYEAVRRRERGQALKGGGAGEGGKRQAFGVGEGGKEGGGKPFKMGGRGQASLRGRQSVRVRRPGGWQGPVVGSAGGRGLGGEGVGVISPNGRTQIRLLVCHATRQVMKQ